MGIDKLLEAMDALKLIGVDAAAIAKGGLGLDDIPKVIQAAKKYDVVAQAVKDFDAAKMQAADISSDEVIVLVAKVLEVVKAVKVAHETGVIPE